MDEVDNIIIHSLRQIGCNIDEDVISLSSFSPELLVETAARCLQLIKPSLNLPKTLPPGMAQRFTVTAALAEACGSIGFRGDIGYQTFLYSNATEVRRVFMFLIERLPKESEKLPLTQPLDKLTALENEICRNISVQLTSAWAPQYCIKSGIRKFDANTIALTSECSRFCPQLDLNIPHSIEKIQKTSPELHNYWLKRSPNVFQKTTSQNICPSVIHKNDIELYSNGSLLNGENLILSVASKTQPNSASNSEAVSIQTLGNSSHKLTMNSSINDKESDDIIVKREPITIQEKVNLNKSNSPLENINLDIEKIKNSIEELLLSRKTMQAQILKLKESRVLQDGQFLALKEERKIKERTCILLENPEVNILKMESILTATEERMKKLSEKWDEHQKPLIEALEKSRNKNSNKSTQNKVIVDQVKAIKERALEVSEDLKGKSALHAQLVNEFQRIDKTISRNAYTTRILEIVGNIRKQKNDIDKVLRDTRELQKEINNLNGQLDRQFTVTDDLLYKTAKRDEYSKKAYKLLATLHSDCSELVSLVQETGAVMREVRDLEDQTENEKACNISTNLEKITLDLKETEKESKELQEKIRKIENQITQG